jgi:Fe2+ or Zn2+ uptake regulation protein
MSRWLWRCHNPGCPTSHGAVMGRLTADGALVLDSAVSGFRCFLDTRHVMVVCPSCGTTREFRGPAVLMSSLEETS